MTPTSTGPNGFSGVVVVIRLSLLTVNSTKVLSKVTLLVSINPLPLITTTVPPAIGPALGVSVVITGASATPPTVRSTKELFSFGFDLNIITFPSITLSLASDMFASRDLYSVSIRPALDVQSVISGFLTVLLQSMI